MSPTPILILCLYTAVTLLQVYLGAMGDAHIYASLAIQLNSMVSGDLLFDQLQEHLFVMTQSMVRAIKSLPQKGWQDLSSRQTAEGSGGVLRSVAEVSDLKPWHVCFHKLVRLPCFSNDCVMSFTDKSKLCKESCKAPFLLFFSLLWFLLCLVAAGEAALWLLGLLGRKLSCGYFIWEDLLNTQISLLS